MRFFSRKPIEFLPQDKVNLIIEGLKSFLISHDFIVEANPANTLEKTKPIFENGLHKGYITQYNEIVVPSKADILSKNVVKLVYTFLAALDKLQRRSFTASSLQENIESGLKNLKNDLNKLIKPSLNMLSQPKEDAYNRFIVAYNRFIADIDTYLEKIDSLIEAQSNQEWNETARNETIKKELDIGYQSFLTYVDAYNCRYNAQNFQEQVSSIIMDWGRDRDCITLNGRTDLVEKLKKLDQNLHTLQMYQVLNEYIKSICGVSGFRAHQIMALAQQGVFGQSLRGIGPSLMTGEALYNCIQEKRKLKIFYSNNKIKIILEMPYASKNLITCQLTDFLFNLTSTIELGWLTPGDELPFLVDARISFDIKGFQPEVYSMLRAWEQSYFQVRRIIRGINYELANNHKFIKFFKNNEECQMELKSRKAKELSMLPNEGENMSQEAHLISMFGEIIGVHAESFFTISIDEKRGPIYFDLLKKHAENLLNQSDLTEYNNFLEMKLRAKMTNAYQYLADVYLTEIPVSLRNIYARLQPIIEFCRNQENPVQEMLEFYKQENSVFKNDLDTYFTELYRTKVDAALSHSEYIIFDALTRNIHIEILCDSFLMKLSSSKETTALNNYPKATVYPSLPAISMSQAANRVRRQAPFNGFQLV